jgi:hypothetical protein
LHLPGEVLLFFSKGMHCKITLEVFGARQKAKVRTKQRRWRGQKIDENLASLAIV